MKHEVRVERLPDCLQASAAGVACVCLFGSIARGESREDSDVAVAVLLVRDVVENRLDDRLEFAAAMRERLRDA